MPSLRDCATLAAVIAVGVCAGHLAALALWWQALGWFTP